MNKKEKALKNIILDILDDYENVARQLNLGYSLSVNKGSLDSDLKDIRRTKMAFRDITLINEEEETKE